MRKLGVVIVALAIMFSLLTMAQGQDPAAVKKPVTTQSAKSLPYPDPIRDIVMFSNERQPAPSSGLVIEPTTNPNYLYPTVTPPIITITNTQISTGLIPREAPVTMDTSLTGNGTHSFELIKPVSKLSADSATIGGAPLNYGLTWDLSYYLDQMEFEKYNIFVSTYVLLELETDADINQLNMVFSSQAYRWEVYPAVFSNTTEYAGKKIIGFSVKKMSFSDDTSFDNILGPGHVSGVGPCENIVSIAFNSGSPYDEGKTVTIKNMVSFYTTNASTEKDVTNIYSGAHYWTYKRTKSEVNNPIYPVNITDNKIPFIPVYSIKDAVAINSQLTYNVADNLLTVEGTYSFTSTSTSSIEIYCNDSLNSVLVPTADYSDDHFSKAINTGFGQFDIRVDIKDNLGNVLSDYVTVTIVANNSSNGNNVNAQWNANDNINNNANDHNVNGVNNATGAHDQNINNATQGYTITQIDSEYTLFLNDVPFDTKFKVQVPSTYQSELIPLTTPYLENGTQGQGRYEFPLTADAENKFKYTQPVVAISPDNFEQVSFSENLFYIVAANGDAVKIDDNQKLANAVGVQLKNSAGSTPEYVELVISERESGGNQNSFKISANLSALTGYADTVTAQINGQNITLTNNGSGLFQSADLYASTGAGENTIFLPYGGVMQIRINSDSADPATDSHISIYNSSIAVKFVVGEQMGFLGSTNMLQFGATPYYDFVAYNVNNQPLYEYKLPDQVGVYSIKATAVICGVKVTTSEYKYEIFKEICNEVSLGATNSEIKDVVAGFVVNFSVTDTVSPKDYEKVQWIFSGDSNIYKGLSVSHAFLQAGNAIATVTGPFGTRTITLNVLSRDDGYQSVNRWLEYIAPDHLAVRTELANLINEQKNLLNSASDVTADVLYEKLVENRKAFQKITNDSYTFSSDDIILYRLGRNPAESTVTDHANGLRTQQKRLGPVVAWIAWRAGSAAAMYVVKTVAWPKIKEELYGITYNQQFNVVNQAQYNNIIWEMENKYKIAYVARNANMEFTEDRNRAIDTRFAIDSNLGTVTVDVLGGYQDDAQMYVWNNYGTICINSNGGKIIIDNNHGKITVLGNADTIEILNNYSVINIVDNKGDIYIHTNYGPNNITRVDEADRPLVLNGVGDITAISNSHYLCIGKNNIGANINVLTFTEDMFIGLNVGSVKIGEVRNELKVESNGLGYGMNEYIVGMMQINRNEDNLHVGKNYGGLVVVINNELFTIQENMGVATCSQNNDVIVVKYNSFEDSQLNVFDNVGEVWFNKQTRGLYNIVGGEIVFNVYLEDFDK